MKGYTLTRLSPLKKDDAKGFEYLQEMLTDIDPCIVLSSDTGPGDDKAFEQYYIETYGMPGTPEFEAKLKEINEQQNK